MPNDAQVALPGDRAPKRETRSEHPGEKHRLGCPMCGSLDLVIDIAATVHRAVAAYFIPGVTRPDYEIGVELGFTDDPDMKVIGVRCGACRWALRSPDCLSKLKPV